MYKRNMGLGAYSAASKANLATPEILENQRHEISTIHNTTTSNPFNTYENIKVDTNNAEKVRQDMKIQLSPYPDSYHRHGESGVQSCEADLSPADATRLDRRLPSIDHNEKNAQNHDLEVVSNKNIMSETEVINAGQHLYQKKQQPKSITASH